MGFRPTEHTSHGLPLPSGYDRRCAADAVRTDPNGTYRDLYLYCAQHTLGSHVGIYNYTYFGNLYTTGPKDFFVKNK